jgi:hypothetical protein
MTICRRYRCANAPSITLEHHAKVNSLALAMSSNSAEDIEHILSSGKTWQRLQENA